MSTTLRSSTLGNNETTTPEGADRIIITGEHIPLTEGLKESVISHCAKLFHHNKDIINIRVALGKQTSHHKPMFVAKGHISIYGPDLVVSAEHEDMYTAISMLVQKLDRKLRSKTGKKLAKRHA